MAQKFHISKDGIARICTAKGPCPLGGEDLHFATKKEAEDFIRKEGIKKHGVLPGIEIEKELTFDERLEKVAARGYPEPEDLEEIYIIEKEREVKFLEDQYKRISKYAREEPVIVSQKLSKAVKELKELKNPKISKSELVEELYINIRDIDNGLPMDGETYELIDNFQEQIDAALEYYKERGYSITEDNEAKDLIEKLHEKLLEEE